MAELIGRQYRIDVMDCLLVRSFVNDVYEVRAGDRLRYVLKVYHHGGWSPEEVRWEQELVAHVAASGVAVAEPVPLVDGRLSARSRHPKVIAPSHCRSSSRGVNRSRHGPTASIASSVP
ncbi:phosphotransferase [Actinopolymorpha pittospori]|uniref:Ser/Thr protein kinase RdoA (MazF antagonist) n=1 Tax=Actinopolymorpha pittospori TaxID=648752 RepID=A0A927RCJ8_9ACTN|nr:Ser/Thr protein kinase RdoA (MazF antagonist) [Actinopolymorpha pittospori]